MRRGCARLVWRWGAALLLASAVVSVAACGTVAGVLGVGEPAPAVAVVGGDARRGVEASRRYGCGACHVIPGVPGAQGGVGPSLAGFAARTYITGKLPNTPPNLVRWIQYPQEVEPGTAMPNLEVTLVDARDLAAHLYTLQGQR